MRASPHRQITRQSAGQYYLLTFPCTSFGFTTPVLPSDIVEIYEIKEIENKKIKVKTRLPDAQEFLTNEIITPIASELNKYIIEKDGKKILDIEKIYEDGKKLEEIEGIKTGNS